MAASQQTIKVNLQRDSLQTPWGFRLQGGADFRTPFTVNKLNAGTPADGQLHVGDIILEINDQPISSFVHSQALAMIQRAGGQISFLIQRGPINGINPNFQQAAQPTMQQRPMSAVPWSYMNHPNSPWAQTTYSSLSPTSCFRNRALERIPEPKPVLSQTGSPIMPGPVPSVSTKSRGFIAPPTFHTDRLDSPTFGSTGSNRFYYPGPTYQPRNRTMSTSSQSSVRPERISSRNSIGNQSEASSIPSYQKKLQSTPVNSNLVHRQFNSPMSLYSNENVQEAMNNHLHQTSPMASIPEQQQTYHITLLPTLSPRSPMSLPVEYVAPNSNNYATDF